MINKIIVITLWISICAVVGYMSPTLPLVKDVISIKTVNVKGTDKFKEEEIKQIFKSQNWFFLTESDINEKLKKYPFVKNVRLYKPHIGQIDLVIEERKPFAILSINGKNYIVDDEDKVLDEKSFSKENLLKINVVDQKFVSYKDVFPKIERLVSNLGIKPKEITISKAEISVLTEKDSLLIFSIENLEEELKKAKIFFAKNSIANYTYLNFSFDEMVIAKK